MNRIRGFAAVAKRQLHRSARACCADTQSGRAPGPMLSKVEVWVPDSGPLRPSRPVVSRPFARGPVRGTPDALHAI